MNNSHLKVWLGTAFLSLTVGGAAYAGGFSRGTADTDIIYEDGNFNMRSGVTYVAPRREYTKNFNPALIGTSYTEDYVIPSAAIKLNLWDSFRCAGTFVQNTGGSAKYAAPTIGNKTLEEFTTYESAATCGVSFDVGPGKLWALGGGYVETFDYLRENNYGALGGATLDLDGQRYGYRIGAAYEIPELALRAQVMYRSGTDYGAEGTATAPAGVLAQALRQQGVPDAQNPLAALPVTMQYPLPALGIGRLPQSVDIKFQTGIAPGWLAFGAVKWTDWSTLTTLDVRAASNGLLLSSDKYFWRDGWTVTGGIGHKFNDTVSGLVSLTWDRGVATGWDLQGATYTVATGVSLKDKLGGELRSGVGFSYLASTAETQYSLAAPVGSLHYGSNSEVKAGYAVAFNLGYNIKW